MIPKIRKKLVKKAKENPKTTAILTALASILSVTAIVGYNSGAFNKKPGSDPTLPSATKLSTDSYVAKRPAGVKPLPWKRHVLENDSQHRFFYSISGGVYRDISARLLNPIKCGSIYR